MAKRKPLTDSTAEKIVSYIQVHKLQPGDKLPTEAKLAELLQVGRGTLREAIRSLVSRNILKVRQGAGTFVSEKNGVVEDPLGLSMENDNDQLALDMVDIRLMLEPEIAFLAAAKATPEQIRALEKQCDKVEELIRQDKPYAEEDALFHQLVAECSQNKVLVRLIPVITSSVSLNVEVTRDQYWAKTIIYHRRVTEAIASRDAHGAKYNMIAHLNVLRAGILENQSAKLRSASAGES